MTQNPYEQAAIRYQQQKDSSGMDQDVFPQEKNPYEDAALSMASNNNMQFGVSVKQGIERQPDRQTEVRRLSNKYGVSPAFVERQYDVITKEEKKSKIKDLRHTNPKLSSWLADPDKVAISHDDTDNLKQVDVVAGRFQWAAQPEKSFVSDLGRGVSTNYMQLDKSLGYMKQVMGIGDSWENAQEIAKKYKALEERSKQDPEYFKEFRVKAGKEYPELQKAFSETIVGAEKVWEGKILEGLSQFGSSGLETASELFDVIGLYGTNKKALAYGASQSLVNSFAPFVLGLSAAPAGAKIGTLAGAPFGPKGAGIGATVGGTGAFLGAATISGTALEFMMEIEGIMQEQGVDMTDPKSIQAAFNNPEIMSVAKEKAAKKAITTASVEAIISLIGGRMIMGAKVPKGATGLRAIAAKAPAVAKSQALEVAGEGIGEFAGQVAREGDIKKASVGEAFEEAASSIFIGGGIGSMSYAISKTKNVREILSKNTAIAAQQVKAVYDKAQEAIGFKKNIDDLTESVQSSKINERSKELMADLINNSSDNAELYLQADDWENHWNSVGENPIQKADELLPGGRHDLENAKAIGGQVRIPVGDFITKFADEATFQELTELVRRQPDSVSAREADKIGENIDQVLNDLKEEARQEIERKRESEQSERVVKNIVADQYEQAGLSKKDSKDHGEIYAAHMKALATIRGTTAEELFNKRRLEVEQAEKTQRNKVIQLMKERDAEIEENSVNGYIEKDLEAQIKEKYNAKINEVMDKELFQEEKRQLDPLGFYSQLKTGVEAMDFKSIPPQDLANRIKKMSGIKQEELEATGILELLETTEGKISKEDVMTFLEQGGLQLEEIVKGGERWNVLAFTGEIVDTFGTQEEAQAESARLKEENGYDFKVSKEVEDMEGDTKFGQYTILGGTNYREVLLRLPEKDIPKTLPDGYELKENPTSKVSPWIVEGPSIIEGERKVFAEGLDKKSAIRNFYNLPGQKVSEKYKSSHWDESNVLAHFRLNDRTDSEGRKTLFIEEIQSDWHQEGRKKGYEKDFEKIEQTSIGQLEVIEEGERYSTTLEGDRYNITKRKEEISEEQKKLRREFGQPEAYYTIYHNGASIGSAAGSLEEAVERINTFVKTRAGWKKRTVPDAPFKQTEAWSILAFKRILAKAVAEGYDAVAWTPGEVQAERYDLSKQLQDIRYKKLGSGTYWLQATSLEGSTFINETGLKEREIEDLIGKELAQKIVNDEGDIETREIGVLEEGEGTKETGFKIIQGEGLKVGGEGMIGFYDKMLPKAVGKYIKKLDKSAKVGVDKITTEKTVFSHYEYEGPTLTIEEVREAAKNPNNNVTEERQLLNVASKMESDNIPFKDAIESYGSPAAAEAVGGKLFTQLKEEGGDVWHVPLTDKIKEEVAKGQTLFQDDTKKRGAIDLSDPEKMVIKLFKDADKSTAIHEMAGHAFLENMKLVYSDLSQMAEGDLNQRQRLFMEDVSTVLEEFGIESLDEVTREHHERFARLSEAFFMEGKAPTPRLQRIFTTFKTWLVNIYKNLMGIEKAAGFDVKLTPEMREVFNRLLATQEEIAEANQEQGYDRAEFESMFERMGIKNTKNNPELDRIVILHEEANQEAELILYREQLEQIKQKKTKEYKADKKRIKAEVQEIADNSPLYIARESISTGKINGEDILGYETIKFNTKMLKGFLTEEEMKNFPKNLYTSKGIDPELTADLLGFENAKTLIEAIKNNPNKKEFIQLETQRRLDEIHPNWMNPEQQNEMKVEAINAVHNDKRSEALNLELQVMFNSAPAQTKKLMGRFIPRLPMRQEIRKAAGREANRTRVKDVRPAQYRMQESKKRKEAGMHMLNGDWEKAIDAKLKELYNYELYRMSYDIQNDVKKKIDKTKKRLNIPDKQLAKKGNVDMLKTAQHIMSRFGMLTEARAESFQTYMAQVKAYDEASFHKIDELSRVVADFEDRPWKELNYEEFIEVMNTIDAIYNLGIEDQIVTIGENRINKDDVIIEMVQAIEKLPKESIKRLDSDYKDGKLFNMSTKAALSRIEHWTRWMDGGRVGPFSKFIFGIANNAQITYDEAKATQKKKLLAIYKEHFKEILNDDTDIDISKYFVNLDSEESVLKKHQIVMALVHSGNRSNLKKLLLGRKWGTLNPDKTLNDARYKAFINDMMDKGIVTQDMMDGVQKIWDMFKEMLPEIQTTYKDTQGYYFEEIESTPLEMFGKIYPGGYAPAVTDPLMVADAQGREGQISVEQEVMQFEIAHTPRGHTMKRHEQYNEALSLDFRIIGAHMEKALRFAKLEKAVMDIGKIINDKKIKESLNEKNNLWRSEVLIPFLGRLATQQTTRPGKTKTERTALDWINFVRNSSNQQIMFWNPVNTLEILGEFNTIFLEVDPSEVWDVAKRYPLHVTKMTENMHNLSKYMKLRQMDDIFEIMEEYNELFRSKTIMNSLRNKRDQLKKHTYMTQRFMQNNLETIAWNAAFNQYVAETKSESKAVQKADSVIRRMFGSNRPIDLANIEAGNAIRKVLLTFYGYFLNKANVVAYAPKGKKLKAYALAIAIPSMLSAMIRKIVMGSYGDESEEELVYDVLDVTVLATAKGTIAGVPFASPAFRLIEGQFTNRTFDDRLSVSPIIGMAESIKGPVSIAKKTFITKKDITSRDIKDTLNFVGTLTGTPLGALGRPIGYMIDVEQGKQTADNAVDVGLGVVTGRSGDRVWRLNE